MTKRQKAALALLALDHGTWEEEPLNGNPVAEEFDLSGYLLVRFDSHRFAIRKDGGLIPLPAPEEDVND